MEEIVVHATVRGRGKDDRSGARSAVIVALRRQGGRLEAQPSPQTVIGAGD